MLIKYQVLENSKSGHLIKSALFHPRLPIIAFVLFSNGHHLYICPYRVTGSVSGSHPEITFQEAFHDEKIDTCNILTWNAEGNQLFNINQKSIKIYSFMRQMDNYVLSNNFYYEESSEILCIAATRDENQFIWGTITGKIVKFNRSNQKKQEVKLPSKILTLVADPLMKFYGALCLNNKFYVLDFSSGKHLKVIDMNLQKLSNEELITFREDKRIDMSPNLNFVLLPNLDDKKMPLVFCIARDSNYDVKHIFGGSFASINCVRFIPIIFYDDEYEYNYFMMGDAHGNITLWELSNSPLKRDSPIFVFRTDDFNITIESMEFSADGRIMICVTNRNFFIMFYFSDFACFKKKSFKTRTEFLEENCGDTDLSNFVPKNYVTLKDKNHETLKTSSTQNKDEVKKVSFRKKNDVVVAAPAPVNSQQTVRTVESAEEDKATKNVKSVSVAPSNGQAVTNAPTSIISFFNNTKETSKLKNTPFFEVQSNKLENNVLLKLRNDYLKYTLVEDTSMIERFSNGNLLWTTGLQCHLTTLEFNEQYPVASGENRCPYFIEVVSGRRSRNKVYMEDLFKMSLNQNGMLLLVRKNGSLLLYDVVSDKVLLTTNVLSMIYRNIPPNANKEVVDSIMNGDLISFSLTSNNRILIKLPNKTFIYDSEFKEWILVDGFVQMEVSVFAKMEELGLNNVSNMEFTDVLNTNLRGDFERASVPDKM